MSIDSEVTGNEVLDIAATLQAFIRGQEAGAFLDYLSVERATGIAMNKEGRAALRAAARAVCGYRSRPRKGIELTAPASVLSHQRERISGLRKATERIIRTSEKDVKVHGEAMSRGDLQKVIAGNAFLATVRMSAAQNVPVVKTLPVFVKETEPQAAE